MQKYNCEKRASNIALSYGVEVDKWSFECFTSLCLYLNYLMQNYAAFRSQFLRYLEVWTFFFIWVFLLRKSGLIFNSPVTTRGNGVNAQRPRAACGRVLCNANAIIYPFKSAIMWRIQTPHLVQLMNIVSNYIFDCNNRDANRAFVTFRENTAPVATTWFRPT